jgi:hypothetical protein
LETGKYLTLTALTFGGYATFRLYAGMWAGYHEQAADGTKMGVLGAINSLNPLYAIAKGALETYRAAEKGDFEAAGEKGVVTAIVTAVTAVGVIQGLGSLPGKPSGSGGAAPLGDLSSTEINQIQNVVNKAGRPLEVVGSAAKGARRNPGTDLPVGKGPGTQSDIDYLVPPSSNKYFQGLDSDLPLIDRGTGIIPGVHNPHIGPAIRFEPFSEPYFVPGVK